MSMSAPSDPQLGELVAEYPANPFNQLVHLVVGVGCLYLAITDLNMQVGYTIYVLGPFWRVVMLLFAAYCGYMLYARVGSSVRLYENGLIYQKRPTPRTILWTEIKKVNQKVTRQNLLYFIPLPGTKNYEMTITLANGDKVEIDSAAISRAQTLSDAVISNVRSVIAARSTQAQ